uniref:Cell wall alpha-1,3-glucan synthase ags1 n=1 Tax=Phakopsora pachyrhizi TaxID=170000 RepID=A0A0S1MJW0_PHAPC
MGLSGYGPGFPLGKLAILDCTTLSTNYCDRIFCSISKRATFKALIVRNKY